jgi:ABC-type branched-subunit amino acid transport system permease subunit
VDIQLLSMQLFSGVALGAILIMLALGLSIIFGILGVVNFAHGNFFMVGAYAGVFFLTYTGSFWWALLLAPIAIGILGLGVERFLIRPLYGRSVDDPILLTFGLGYILIEGVRILFGTEGIPFGTPAALRGVTNIGIGFFPTYRLFVIAVVACIVLALWLGLEKTKTGLIIRAGARDPQIMRVLGVDIQTLWLVVFGIGTGLAALGGVLAAPMRTVSPEMGASVLSEAFVVTVIGGMGSLLGSVVAGLLVGIIVSMTSLFAPEMATIAMFAFMTLVLLVRPQGLFGKRGLGTSASTQTSVPEAKPDSEGSAWHWLASGQLARWRVPLSIVALCVLPWVLPSQALAVDVLIYGLFAVGYNLLFGYTGLLSFGHAAFFGAGAYVTGIAIGQFGANWFVGMALGVTAAGMLALAIGALSIRTRGIYFAMVTLALAQLVYYIALQASAWTGGENGLRGFTVARVGFGNFSVDFLNPVVKYYVILVFVALALWFLSRILASPFGGVIEAIRENEVRASACGFNVARTKLQAFALSGLFCGLAGALSALHLSIVPLDTLSYTTSGQVVMMTLLGGVGTFFGPFIGAFVVVVMESVLSQWTSHWQLFLGAVFVIFVLYLPNGIWGTMFAWAAGRRRS